MRQTPTIIETRKQGRVQARGTHTNRWGRPPCRERFADAEVLPQKELTAMLREREDGDDEYG